MSRPTPEFLLIDVGNTRLKWAVAGRRGRIVPAGDIATRSATAARIGALARKYRGRRVVLASVVPKLVPIFRRAFGGRLHVVSAASPALGLRFDYPRPSELGGDRLAAAVAAYAEGKWPAIIVACGTATAVTVLDAKGRVAGGVIAPGLQTQLAALLGATAQLPDVVLKRPRSVLAKSTREAIRAGALLSFQGGVKESIRQLSQGLPGRRRPRVLLTGGHARRLSDELGLPAKLRPLLVFEGLRIMGARLDPPVT
jgi:type III pantothenate kinase